MDVLKRSELCLEPKAPPRPLKVGDVVRGDMTGRVGVVTGVTGTYAVLWLARGDAMSPTPYTDTGLPAAVLQGPLNASIVLEDE